jgi:hypothetical protein
VGDVFLQGEGSEFEEYEICMPLSPLELFHLRGSVRPALSKIPTNMFV